MIYLRFYYFVFLKSFTKPENPAPWFSALLVVELSVFFLIAFMLLLFDRYFLDGGRAMFGYRGFGILANVAALYVLYIVLAKNGKSEAIFSEFVEHPMNTRKNRITCWIIWIALMLLPMVTATIFAGSISLTSNSDFK